MSKHGFFFSSTRSFNTTTTQEHCPCLRFYTLNSCLCDSTVNPCWRCCNTTLVYRAGIVHPLSRDAKFRCLVRSSVAGSLMIRTTNSVGGPAIARRLSRAGCPTLCLLDRSAGRRTTSSKIIRSSAGWLYIADVFDRDIPALDFIGYSETAISICMCMRAFAHATLTRHKQRSSRHDTVKFANYSGAQHAHDAGADGGGRTSISSPWV